MLDLKSKLAAAGLVTQKDIDRVAKDDAGGRRNSKKKPRRGGQGQPGGKGAGAGSERSGVPRLAVDSLRSRKKGEQYEAVRRFVERVRLHDPARAPTEQAKTFHFATAKGQIGRLVLEPEVLAWVIEGSAGVVAYMSNHGVAHAIVPAAAARELFELFPLWLRVLEGHPEAGRIEAPPEAAPTSEPAPTSEAEAEPEP